MAREATVTAPGERHITRRAASGLARIWHIRLRAMRQWRKATQAGGAPMRPPARMVSASL
jgi:hypothetical protein